MSAETIWATLARPLLLRLDETGRWQREDRATDGLPFPDMRIASAERGGFVQRRRHWLTGRREIRLTVPGYARAKVVQMRGRG